MARSILVWVSSSLGWAQSPSKPLLYRFAEGQAILCRSGYMGDEASLCSGRRGSTSTGQARRCGALLGRPPNDEDATDDDRGITGRETRRASSTKQGCKNAGMIVGAKLDGLATRHGREWMWHMRNLALWAAVDADVGLSWSPRRPPSCAYKTLDDPLLSWSISFSSPSFCITLHFCVI